MQLTYSCMMNKYEYVRKKEVFVFIVVIGNNKFIVKLVQVQVR